MAHPLAFAATRVSSAPGLHCRAVVQAISAELQDEAGSLIAGKYRHERVIGRGGVGLVIEATHVGLGHRVAIKLLHHRAAKSEHARERFMREACAAAKLTSPHVARVYDVGELEDGLPYMVMELLDGMDLQALVEEDGPLPPSVAASYVLEACDAVEDAHHAGIVHRDLKPANLFLTRRRGRAPMIKVLDFGISKDRTREALTNPACILGSFGFMSPEQMASSVSVNARSDIWSLGATLYALVTGRAAFPAENLQELMAKVQLGEPPDPRAVNPRVPAALAKVIRRCMARDPSRRFSSVRDLAVALRPCSVDDPAGQAKSRGGFWMWAWSALAVLLAVGSAWVFALR